MSQKLQKTLETTFGTIARVHSFDRIKDGMTLYRINGLTNDVEHLGTVTTTASELVGDNKMRQSLVILDNGLRMTRKGWSVARLWKRV